MIMMTMIEIIIIIKLQKIELKEMLEEKKPEPEESFDAPKPAQPQAPADPGGELRKASSGTLKLIFPIRAASTDVTELNYDFCGLSSLDMMEALDRDGSFNLIGITNRQALYLFAATAAKCNGKVDENDVLSRLSSADAVKAVQLAKLFYVASNRRGKKNT